VIAAATQAVSGGGATVRGLTAFALILGLVATAARAQVPVEVPRGRYVPEKTWRAPKPKAPSVEALAGRYVYVGSQEIDERAIAHQIRLATKAMEAGKAKETSAELRGANPIPTAIHIATDEQVVTIAVGGENVTVPVDGAPQPFETKGGGHGQVWFDAGSASLRRALDGGESTRVTSFSMNEKGQLLVTFEQRAPGFYAPMQYALTYQRAGAGSRSSARAVEGRNDGSPAASQTNAPGASD
jgi:hypothetical protein